MKEKICRFFYKHGMKRIAYRISPSLVCCWDMEKFREGFKKGIEDVCNHECETCIWHEMDDFCSISERKEEWR